MVEGAAVASRHGRPVGMLGAGDCFGERSIVSGKPADSSIVALTPLLLLVADGRSFPSLVERFPCVAARLVADLAARRPHYEDAGCEPVAS